MTCPRAVRCLALVAFVLGGIALALPAQAAPSQTIVCSKGGSLNPLLQGSGIAGGATCTFSGFPASTAIVVSGGLHLTPTTTNVDGSASGVLYSVCSDALGDYVITFTVGAVAPTLKVTVATNPNFATDCPTQPTTTVAPVTTTTAPPAAQAAAVTAAPHFTG